MPILSTQSLNKIRPLYPWYSDKQIHHGLSFGLSCAGYDIRVAETFWMWRGRFKLASSVEHFKMPDDLLAQVCDKSSLARRGLFVQNTIVEPGWRGYLTLELTYHGWKPLKVISGQPIAQILFLLLDYPTERPYEGKYQDQRSGVTEAIYER